MQNYVGIDISKDDFHFCAINEKAETIHSGQLPMSSDGFSQLLSILNTLSNPVVVMESSGRYHLPLYCFLLSHSIQTFILNPKITHRFFEFISANNPSKCDKKDAKIIALFAISNPQFLTSSPDESNLRSLARLIQKLKKELAEAKTQIKYSLSVLFPEAEKSFNIYSHTFLHILLKYPCAKTLSKAKPNEIAKIINNSIVRGRKVSFAPDELISTAKTSIGIEDPYYAQSLVLYIEKLFFLEPRIEKLEQMLMDEIQKTDNDQLKLISSIKGISEKLAGLFLAEVRDIKIFPNAKSIIKYAGTDPVVKQSGKYTARMSISKQGSAYLRNILFQMTVGVVKWNPYFREYFLRKKKQFGSFKKAIIAVLNKLIRVIHALCRKGSLFNPDLHSSSCHMEFPHV